MAPQAAPIEVGGVRHTNVAVTKNGRPVFNRRGRLHQRDEPLATLPSITGWASAPRFAPADRVLDRSAAIDLAARAASVVRPRESPRAHQGWFAVGDRTLPAWRVEIASYLPLGSFQITVDARTGEILQNVDRLRAAEGRGDVHAPNPVQAPLPSEVVLSALDESGSLAGDFTCVVDPSAPSDFRPARDFFFPVNDPRFVQTGIYHNLTRTGELAIETGFPVFPRPVIAVANLRDASGDPLNNAFYDPLTPAFLFGNGRRHDAVPLGHRQRRRSPRDGTSSVRGARGSRDHELRGPGVRDVRGHRRHHGRALEWRSANR